MGFWDIFQRKPAEPVVRDEPKVNVARRGFNAAAVNRFTTSWLTQSRAIDEELKKDLDALRVRSRDLAKNSDYIKKFLQMVSVNVVGPSGFMLQSRVTDTSGAPDKLACDAIEEAFVKWSRKGICEITGRWSFVDIQRLKAKCTARDGEFLIRHVRGEAAGNAFGYAIQLLDITRLDTMLNREFGQGRNAIVMGVEMDSYRRPVAYWLRAGRDPNAHVQHERVPASDILHGYLPEDDEQARGYPWGHAAMMRLHNLKGYEEAAIVAARSGAAKMGFFVSPDGSAGALADSEEEGEFYSEAEAGTFGVLPVGYDFKSYDPDYPHEQFPQFVKAALRGIASGLGVSYNGLASDLEGVNFSSIRAGVLEERDQWMAIQDWFVEAFILPVFEEWLKMALLNGAIKNPNGSPLPLAKYDKFSVCQWLGRRWQWVDPERDLRAEILAVSNGLKSPQQLAAELGTDIEDVLSDIKEFQQLVADKGVSLQTGINPGNAPQAAPVESIHKEQL